MLNDQSCTAAFAPAEYCTSCFVCSETTQVSVWDNHVKICEYCKKVIMFIKERFKGEYEN